jgi:ankyrin repeat protein
MVELLLLWGADIHERNDGLTALHMATDHGHQDVIELLISEGADIHSYGNGYTPLHSCKVGSHQPYRDH